MASAAFGEVADGGVDAAEVVDLDVFDVYFVDVSWDRVLEGVVHAVEAADVGWLVEALSDGTLSTAYCGMDVGLSNVVVRYPVHRGVPHYLWLATEEPLVA